MMKRVFFSAILFLFFPALFSVHVPSNFGKTHFILGADSTQIQRQKKVKRLKRALHVPKSAQQLTQVFFAPDDDTQKILIDLIACEQKSIRMAAYLLTDVAIAKALIAAKKRGVYVEVVTDKFCCTKFGKVNMLLKHGIDVFVYKSRQPRGSYASDIMHNKFILFEKNLLGRSLVWTGSFNFTNSARLRNQENILLLDNKEIIKKYTDQFVILKSRSEIYETHKFQKENKRYAHKKNETRRRFLSKGSTKGMNREARSKKS